ncbi:MAG: magnesium transporter CorA family protein [Spirochaetales bacterium]|nr:magnesium transporter CorA family protein [Spirochaetales bacterium]
MITIRGARGAALENDAAGRGSWNDVRRVSRADLDRLEREYGILPDHLQDMLDADEESRIEKEDEYTLLVVRVPVFEPGAEVSYFTVPLGVFLFPDRVVTVCQGDCEVLRDLADGKVRDLDVANRSAFVLHLLGRAALVFLRHLKDLNRRTTVIERELQRSVKNHELIQLLSIQKSLVYFTTSLKANELLLEKLQNGRILRFREEESELLEDVLTDNKQAISMADIHSDIITGTMDAFASVISNNLNIVMKRLTVISICLMLPTFIVSAFGMNIPLPWHDDPYALVYVGGVSLGLGLVGAIVLRDRKPRLRRARVAAPVAGIVHGGVAPVRTRS